MGKRALGASMMFGVLTMVALVGCLDDESEPIANGPPPECRFDTDCAKLDTDSDPCTVVQCVGQKCQPTVLKNTTECQCAVASDCLAVLGANNAPKACSSYACDAHKCAEKITPAGPALKQDEGGCVKVTCDGVSTEGKREGQADGADCDRGFCFAGKCLSCKPQNASSCAKEGPSEPANDTGAGAASYTQEQSVCGFTGGDDVDWYTFFAEDGDFSNDILHFKLWSSAPTIETCIYVKCQNNGAPEGGCTDLEDGPNGSRGCCYAGAPTAVAPRWDLDCTGSGDDSGTVYVSVRATGGGACERYALSGGY